jgi:hypothetical protein
MPVLPPGIPPYPIHPPCTVGDKGIPSSSITTDVQRVLNLIADERHLTAHSLYISILHRIQRYDDDHDINHQRDHNQNTNQQNSTTTTPSTSVSDSRDNRMVSNDTTKRNMTKQKSKTFTSSFLNRGGGSNVSKQLSNGKHDNKEDEEMMKVKEIVFQSKKHIFVKLEVRYALPS